MDELTETFRVRLSCTDDRHKDLFLKVIRGHDGKEETDNEWRAMYSIYEYTYPSPFCPRPVGSGTYVDDPERHFCLYEFVEMVRCDARGANMPDPDEFAEQLANLHLNSVPSITGKFGFDFPTYTGGLPQHCKPWEEKWEDFFAASLRYAFDREIEAVGNDCGFGHLLPFIFDTVIPRLLRPLQDRRLGRTLKPRLVHGELTRRNVGLRLDTRKSVAYNPACLFAHNECELPSQWELLK